MKNRRPRAYRHSLKEDDPGSCVNTSMEVKASVSLCDTKNAESFSRKDLQDPELLEECSGYAVGTIVSPECHGAGAKNDGEMHKSEIETSEDHLPGTSSPINQEMVGETRPGSEHRSKTETAEPEMVCKCIMEKNQDGPHHNSSQGSDCHSSTEAVGCNSHNASTGDSMMPGVEKPEHSKTGVPIEAEVLGQIKEILDVARGFTTYLAAKTELSDIESLNIDGMGCNAYCCGVLGEGMRNIRFSDSFIYNKRIRGKSGSLIFFTEDFKHAIKVIKPKELNVFIKNIPVVSRYLDTNSQSLIVRSVGLYSTPNMNFVVMENVFGSSFGQIFDLKGMNVKRRPMEISTENDWKGNRLLLRDKRSMMEIISEDTLFLESLNLMDYSLVIGRNRDCSNAFRGYDGEGNETVSKAGYSGGYSLGIVDVLTEYDCVKKLERIGYLLCCMDSASAVDPREYRSRFMDLIRNECFEEEVPMGCPENK